MKRHWVKPLWVVIGWGAASGFVACAGNGYLDTDSGTATSTGDPGGETRTGSSGAKTSTGSSGTAMSSGTTGTAMTSGTTGTAMSSGTTGTAMTSGTSGTAMTSGTSDTAMTSGSSSTAKSTGTTGTAMTSGSSSTAKSSSSSGTAMSTSSSSASASSSTAATMTPCDVLRAGGQPCVAAHSTVRVVYGGYTGPLYQVCNGAFTVGPSSCTSGNTLDIGSVGGYANAAAQDTFCAGGSCTISIIYDQSANHNDLKPTASGGGAKSSADNPASATALKTTLNGHEAYGVLISSGIGYRILKGVGTATGDNPETEYMVTSQNNLFDSCCFDYGNAETDDQDDGNGATEAVYFGGGVVWGTGVGGNHADGPWVMADLENGLFAGWQNNQNQNISTNTALKFNFVTAVIVGDVKTANGGSGRFALYGADATAGTLTTEWDGIRPTGGYVPMVKQGSIVLGTAGDNSDAAGGEWYEGVMTTGAATLATLNNVQANIVAAGYGK